MYDYGREVGYEFVIGVGSYWSGGCYHHWSLIVVKISFGDDNCYLRQNIYGIAIEGNHLHRLCMLSDTGQNKWPFSQQMLGEYLDTKDVRPQC